MTQHFRCYSVLFILLTLDMKQYGIIVSFFLGQSDTYCFGDRSGLLAAVGVSTLVTQDGQNSKLGPIQGPISVYIY